MTGLGGYQHHQSDCFTAADDLGRRRESECREIETERIPGPDERKHAPLLERPPGPRRSPTTVPPQAGDDKHCAQNRGKLEPQRQLCQHAEVADGAAQCVLPPDKETPGGCGNAEPKAHAGSSIHKASVTKLKVVLLVYREQLEGVAGHESPVEEKEVGHVEGRVEDKKQGC